MLDVQEAHSDFGSCVSSSSDSSSSESDGDHLVDKRIKGWESIRKRKKRLTPSKDHFLKKQNTAVSPRK